MGEIRKHPPVKLFAAITYHQHFDKTKILEILNDQIDTIDQRTEPFQFDTFTDYYQSMMGDKLLKFFVSFAHLIPAETLPQIKVQTNTIEKSNESDKLRLINIDPGYLTENKVVLATTKNYSHRLYLSDGIFGDLHLFFKDQTFQFQKWTYPDYKQSSVIAFFNNLRKLYREQLIPVS
ncbi:MAG: DUF4416 family protein [Caldithrix sp.]|nr:DUF4416 family protein [Caldithrix sp.]